MEELRHLILAPEREALEKLHHRVANPESRTQDVSSVVAEAIQRRRQQGGDVALSDALAPTVESALRESVRRDPTALADALFPVMGPAIRRSVLETLRSFIESFNQIMDQSLSWQGLRWRVEAMRTGRSFTEVVLLHSLVFRVEQVFLIHKKTGLPLAHVVAPAVSTEDPSLVSGMLTAIQDFVRDSFHAPQGQAVARMSVGELDVRVEEGPLAILAVVIRGIAPRALRDKMAETLENIHRLYAPQLENFSGDSAPFASVGEDLSRCLEFKYKDEPKQPTNSYALIFGAALLLLLGAWTGYRWWQYHRWNNLVSTLRQQPGLLVTSFDREHGRFVIQGLRDPLASDPATFVAAAGLDPSQGEFHWNAYYALDDALVQQRATTLLVPPPGVEFHVLNGVLTARGAASAKWVEDASSRAAFLPGIRSVDLSNVQLADREQAKREVLSAILLFPLASANPTSADLATLRALAPQLHVLLESPAGSAAPSTTIEIVGHSDSSGAEVTNRPLSQNRANRIAIELTRLGIPRSALQTRGVAAAEPLRNEASEETRKFNRSVTFRIRPSESPH